MAEPTIEPVTWRMLEEVRAALLNVRRDGGYYTDLGLAPIALEGEQVPAGDAPYTVVLGTDIEVDDAASTRTTLKSALDIVIEFTLPVPLTENAQRLAHRARNDVLRALVPLRKDIKDRPLGVNAFQVIASAIQQPADGAATVVAQVVARAGLTETFLPAN